MGSFISPTGNPEVWDEKPEGYFDSIGEWQAARPPEEIQAEFTGAIQARLDAFAQTRGYDGILSAATYATSTIPQFAAEGQYAVEARDTTWAKGYEILNAVLAGQRPMPTLEEVFAELPVLEWPDGAAWTQEKKRERGWSG